MKNASFLQFSFQKSIASALVAALLLTTPGLGVYEAAAKVLGKAPVSSVPAGFNAPIGAGLVSAPGMSGASSLLKVDALGASLPMIDGMSALSARESIVPAAGVRKSPAAAPAQAAAEAAVPSIGIKIAPRAVKSDGTQARTPRVTAKQTLSGTVEAVRRESTQGRVSAAPINHLFDFSRRSAEAAAPVRGAFGSMRANGLARSAAIAVNAADEPAVPTEAKGAVLKSGPSLTLVLGLAAIGAGAAFYFAPAILAAAGAGLAYAGLALPAFVVSHPLWTAIGLGSFGAAAGAAVSQYPLWRAYPGEILRGAGNAGRNTFKFWARFGRIFDAVLTGRSTDDAMKAALPLNIFKYPVLAWPFVLAGMGVVPVLMAAGTVALAWPLLSIWGVGAALVFGGAPIAFAAGFLYKVLETPALAALRGIKQIAVEFFPWLIDFFSFLSRVVRKLFPFIGGGLWGIVRAGGMGMMVGFMTSARPTWDAVVEADYLQPGADKRDRLYSFPQRLGEVLIKIAGGLAAGVSGVIGGVTGLVLSLPYMPVHSLHTALEWAKINGRLAAFTKRFHNNLNEEDGFSELGSTRFSAAAGDKSISLAQGVVRLANAPIHAGYLVAALVSSFLTLYARTWSRTLGWTTRPERVRAERLDPVDETADKASTASNAPANPNFWAPLILGAVGAAAGGAAAFTVLLGGALSLAWWPLTLLALGAAGGGFLGFAASQPSAWSGIFGSLKREALSGAAASFRASARLGLRTDAALRDKDAEEALFREAPASLGRYPWLARPGVALGYAAAVVGFVAGPVAVAAGTLTQAAWTGFVSMVERFLPALKRILRGIIRILRNIVPFAFGFVWGGLRGLFITGAVSAAVTAGPVFDAVFDKDLDVDESRYDMDGIAQIIAVRAMQLVAVIGLIAAGLYGFVVGLVYGLPFTVVFALSKAFDWANVGGKSEAFFKRWEKQALSDEEVRFEQLVRSGFSRKEKSLSLWQGIARLGNTLGAAALSPLTGLPLAASVFVRTISRAARGEREPEEADAASSPAERTGETPAPVNDAPAPKIDSLSGAALAAGLGLLGAAAAGYAGFALALPVLGLAASALAGAAVGFALSQPAVLRTWPSAIAAGVREGASSAWRFWTSQGARYAMTLKGDRVPAASVLGALHYAGGVIGTAVTSVAGFTYGLVSVPVRASLVGAHKVALSLWPWLKSVFKTLGRIARRFFPFAFGGVLGLGVGVFGTALFGALLLGRPWFKYIVAEEYDTSTTGKFLGASLLRIVASLIGIGAGLVGAGVFFALPAALGWYFLGPWGTLLGLAAALPYSLTLSAAMAFWLGDIGGGSQRFFDLWSKVALRVELHRMNKLTDSMEFNETRKNGEIQPADGWVRLANVTAGTFAAAVAGIVASLVTYPRSLYRTGRDLSAGKTVPEGQGFDDFDVAWSYTRKGRRNFSKWMRGLIGAGGMLYGAYLVISSFFTGGFAFGILWKAFLYASLAWPAGWIAGVVLGLVGGFAVGAVVWLARQLAKAPPEAETKK